MTFLIVVTAYIFAHGVTALVVTPLQSIFLPEHTVFASLIYLPHGVRVLATWAFGWRAIPALFIGVCLSAWLFTPVKDLSFLDPALLMGMGIGSFAAFLAFECIRYFGGDYYFGSSANLNWKVMISIGAMASIINSIGQTFAFSGFIELNKAPAIFAIYAVGDLVGLVVCMVVLMLCFRWFRWLSLTGRKA